MSRTRWAVVSRTYMYVKSIDVARLGKVIAVLPFPLCPLSLPILPSHHTLIHLHSYITQHPLFSFSLFFLSFLSFLSLKVEQEASFWQQLHLIHHPPHNHSSLISSSHHQPHHHTTTRSSLTHLSDKYSLGTDTFQPPLYFHRLASNITNHESVSSRCWSDALGIYPYSFVKDAKDTLCCR